MKKKLTRRQFVETSLMGSVVVVGGPAQGVAQSIAEALPQETESPSSVFGTRAQTVLKAAIDEIIPAADGMPAASQVGVAQYIDRLARQNPQLEQEFKSGLTLLQTVSRERLNKEFLQLSSAGRVEAIVELEKKASPEFFRSLRDYTYEGYYTQPRVWDLLGYEVHTTLGSGPRMKPFDEEILAKVRDRPQIYREVE